VDIDFSPARAARTSAAIGDTLGNAPEDYVDPGPGATLRDGLAVRGERSRPGARGRLVLAATGQPGVPLEWA